MFLACGLHSHRVGISGEAERGSGIGLKLLGLAEPVFDFIPEYRSRSPRMLFGLIPESRSLVGIPELRQERGSDMRPSDSFHIYESATYAHMTSVERVSQE